MMKLLQRPIMYFYVIVSSYLFMVATQQHHHLLDISPIFVVEATKSSTDTNYACSKFKAPNSKTDPDLIQKWNDADELLWKYVNEQVPAVLDHTGSAAFDEHLKGVQAVLVRTFCIVVGVVVSSFHDIYVPFLSLTKSYTLYSDSGVHQSIQQMLVYSIPFMGRRGFKVFLYH